jgi:hypothetical protein
VSTIALVVSPDGKTTTPAAGSHIVKVDSEQYANDPAKAIDNAERILTLPPDEELEPLAGSYRNPPEGTADPEELAMARLLADVAFGTGGLADCYRIVPAVHASKVVVLFGEASGDGLMPFAELWPPRDGYSTIPAGDGEDSEKLLERPELPPLSVGIFPRYRDGSTSDLINQIDEASPATLLLAIVAAFKRVGEGIYDGAETAENRAIGIDVTLILAD